MNYSKVKVYATTTCPYCTMIENWLTNKHIKFEKVMVDQDEKVAIDMVRRTGQMGVPVTEIEYPNRKSAFIVGFNQPRLAYMLGLYI